MVSSHYENLVYFSRLYLRADKRHAADPTEANRKALVRAKRKWELLLQPSQIEIFNSNDVYENRTKNYQGQP